MSFYQVKNDKFIQVYDEKELTEMVLNSVQYYRERADYLGAKNKELHEHALEMANEELKNEIHTLKQQLDLSYGQFASKKEKEAYDEFEKEHMHERLTMKIQGGKAPYLIPTYVGVGTNLEVVCPICGEKKNITDTEAW